MSVIHWFSIHYSNVINSLIYPTNSSINFEIWFNLSLSNE